jgi:hypothetical protein
MERQLLPKEHIVAEHSTCCPRSHDGNFEVGPLPVQTSNLNISSTFCTHAYIYQQKCAPHLENFHLFWHLVQLSSFQWTLSSNPPLPDEPTVQESKRIGHYLVSEIQLLYVQAEWCRLQSLRKITQKTLVFDSCSLIKLIKQRDHTHCKAWLQWCGSLAQSTRRCGSHSNKNQCFCNRREYWVAGYMTGGLQH